MGLCICFYVCNRNSTTWSNHFASAYPHLCNGNFFPIVRNFLRKCCSTTAYSHIRITIVSAVRNLSIVEMWTKKVAFHYVQSTVELPIREPNTGLPHNRWRSLPLTYEHISAKIQSELLRAALWKLYIHISRFVITIMICNKVNRLQN